MIIMGIDVGFSGAIATIENGDAWAMVMPLVNQGGKNHLDLHRLAIEIRNIGPDMVVIEKQWARPISGKTQCFNLGLQFGAIQGIIVALRLPYQLVTPQKWKKSILIGYDKSDKSGAVLYVQRKYPKVNLLETPRCRKPHDGMADAICLAEYGSF